MTFSADIAEIPFNPAQQTATGLLAPIMRASGHILYTMAAIADEGYTISDEEVQRELEHAAGHLIATTATVDDAPVSAACKNIVRAFCAATLAAHQEWTSWPEADRTNNLRHLANRASAIGAFFDGELAGVFNSDPGSSL